jgi:hypothetical protein
MEAMQIIQTPIVASILFFISISPDLVANQQLDVSTKKGIPAIDISAK